MDEMVILSSIICCEHREDGELSASFHEGLLSVSGDLKSELERPLSEQDCLSGLLCLLQNKEITENRQDPVCLNLIWNLELVL